MPRRPESSAYIAFGLFCVLTSARDVWSEVLFKGSERADPMLVLLVYAVVTMVIALVVGQATRQPVLAARVGTRHLRAEVALASFYTALAFAAMFLAIASPVGAALSALIEYGAGPAMTAAAATLLLRERSDTRLVVSVLIGVVGTGVLLSARLTRLETTAPMDIALGLGCAIVASFATAMYRVYYKRLLNAKLPKPAIVFYRMTMLVPVLAGVVAFREPVATVSIVVPAVLIGACGFALPIFLMLNAMQSLLLRRVALLMFLTPLTTFALSWAVGYAHIGWSECIGSVMILAAVLYDSSVGEERERPPAANALI